MRNRILFGAAILVASATALLPLAATTVAPPDGARTVSSISYGRLVALAKENKLAAVTLGSGEALALGKDGSLSLAAVPPDARLSDRLVALGVDVAAVPKPRPGFLSEALQWLPILLMVAYLFFIVRGQRGGRSGNPFAVGRSKIRRHDPGKGERVTFGDVAGVGQAKEDLREVVAFLREPERFRGIGARPPRGILLVGPPGTGKTLLARAVAGEAGVPFFHASGSDFVEMYVGLGASRVRHTFETARRSAPCILFIDEIDALGRHRGSGTYGNDEREQTLNQLLVEMGGFETADGVVVLAATNRPDVLDAALLRPGRFDRQVTVPNPDIAGRAAIAAVHLRRIVLAEGLDPLAAASSVAKGTPGFSGADLQNLVNEAALVAARRGADAVSQGDFELARDRIMLGAESRTLRMTDEERRITAWHEAAHALCAVLEPASDPVHKATVVPRGQALGLVLRLPETDRVSLSLERLEADLTVAMAGREAEILVFGERKVTTGASADIAFATDLARRMVGEWGFSPVLGTVLNPPDTDPFSRAPAMSQETAAAFDAEVRRIVAEASGRAAAHLVGRRDALDALAEALLERETLDGDEIRALVAATP